MVVDGLCEQVGMTGVDAHGGATSRLRWHPKPLASSACACPALVPLAPPRRSSGGREGSRESLFSCTGSSEMCSIWMRARASLARPPSPFARRVLGAFGASLRRRTGAEAEAASAAAMAHEWCVVTGAGTRLLASCGQDHTLRIWDVDL